MLRFIAEWLRTMSAAFYVAAFLGQGGVWLSLVLATATISIAVYLFDKQQGVSDDD